MISKHLETALEAAVQEAQRRRHEYLCAEHLLFVLLDDDMGQRILERCGADLDRLR